MEEKYLNELIDLNDFKIGVLNLIMAPCGSGKTTLGKEKLKEMYEDLDQKVLYLIDTFNGREALLRHGDGKGKDKLTGEIYYYIKGVKVMTYAGFAKMCEFEELYKYDNNSVIFCDELQSCIKFSKIKNKESEEEINLHIKALELIQERINTGNNYVIAATATPEPIRRYFNDVIYDVPLYGIPKSYKDRERKYYTNLNDLLNTIDKGSKGIIYVTHIKTMIHIISNLSKLGHKVNGFWSIRNEKYPMDDEQLKLRMYVLYEEKIPEDIDILVINASSETSINIRSYVDFIIVHSTDETSQIQARGRYRNDLNLLYVYDSSGKYIVLPQEYLNIELCKNDTKKLCEILGLKNKSGRLLGWTSIREKLEENGYSVCDYRTNKKRWHIIEELC